MGFGPYSQVVKPAEWVDPLDLNIYAQGMQYKQQVAEKNLQDISSAYNSIFSIDAHGPDKKKMAELEDQFRQQIAGMNFSDLGNMQTMSQIRNVIGEFGTNKDILSVAQRSAFKKQEEQKMEEARKKGRTYSNKNYDRMMRYYSGDEYMQSPESFSLSSGYLVPEIQKKQEAITKAVTRQVTELGADGRIRTYNKIDGEAAQKQWAYAIKNDPELSTYYRDRFEDEYEGVDWDVKGKEMLTQARNTALELAYRSTGAEQQEYKEKARKYEQAINSNYAGSRMKEIFYDEFLDNDADNYGNTINAYDLKDIKADQFALENKKQAQRIQLEAVKQKAKQEAAVPGINKVSNEMRKTLIRKAINLGVTDIYDNSTPDGFISNEELSKKTGEKINKKKEEVKKEEKKDKKILVDSKLYNFDDIESLVEGGDEAAIKDILKRYLGETTGIEQIEISGDNINYDRSGWSGNWTGWDQKISKKELIDKLKNVFSIKEEEAEASEEEVETPVTPAEETSETETPVTFENTQYVLQNGDTITVPIITNLADTSKLNPGDYFSYNDKLYTN